MFFLPYSCNSSCCGEETNELLCENYRLLKDMSNIEAMIRIVNVKVKGTQAVGILMNT